MTEAASPFESARYCAARKVADAVLYEGYLLYPYRASAVKNQLRWQWGVLAPASCVARLGERSLLRVECLLEAGAGADIAVEVRFLHLRVRRSDGGDPAWEEGIERQYRASSTLAELGRRGLHESIALPAGEESDGVHSYRWDRLDASVDLVAQRVDGPHGASRLSLRVANTTSWKQAGAGRSEAVRHSLVGTHCLLGVTGGRFVSLLEPPEWAAPAVAACHNEGVFPVLAGDPTNADLVLASPIILYDYPAVAPESRTELFDSTEIDEILTLRTMALSDEEKIEVRATDPRAAALLEGVDGSTPESLSLLHATLRAPPPARVQSHPAPADSAARTCVAQTARVAEGTKVVLRPRKNADAQDMFLAGREATVESVLTDVDGRRYFAVTLSSDPYAELYRSQGRYLYFGPDEVEVVAK